MGSRVPLPAPKAMPPPRQFDVVVWGKLRCWGLLGAQHDSQRRGLGKAQGAAAGRWRRSAPSSAATSGMPGLSASLKWCSWCSTGATGFTGSLVAEHLARDYQTGVKWALAGRRCGQQLLVASMQRADRAAGNSALPPPLPTLCLLPPTVPASLAPLQLGAAASAAQPAGAAVRRCCGAGATACWGPAG